MADHRIDQNSSDHTVPTWALQQLAIQDAQMAQQRAEELAAEAAFAAARRRPAVENPGIQATFTPFPQSLMPPRARRKGK